MLSCRGFDGRDRVDADAERNADGDVDDSEDEEVGKKETVAPREGGGSFSSKCARACACFDSVPNGDWLFKTIAVL